MKSKIVCVKVPSFVGAFLRLILGKLVVAGSSIGANAELPHAVILYQNK